MPAIAPVGRSYRCVLAAYGLRGLLQLCNERVSEREEQRDTYSDHSHGIEQCDNEEHFRLQHRSQLRLASSTFEEAAAKKTHANTDAKCAEADQKCDSNRREANYSFHQFLLDRIKSSLLN